MVGYSGTASTDDSFCPGSLYDITSIFFSVNDETQIQQMQLWINGTLVSVSKGGVPLSFSGSPIWQGHSCSFTVDYVLVPNASGTITTSLYNATGYGNMGFTPYWFSNSPETLVVSNSLTATSTVTQTYTSTYTFTLVNTPTQTPTPTVAWTNTSTPADTPTFTDTPLILTKTPTMSDTFTNTPTYSETPVMTSTSTDTQTNTPTITDTLTATPTPSNTDTGTTFTATATPTETPVTTPAETPTGTATEGTGNANSVMLVSPNPVQNSGPVSIQLNMGSASNGRIKKTAAVMEVKVQVYTVNYRKIQDFTVSRVPAGGSIGLETVGKWGKPLANGLYFIKVNANGVSQILKLLVLR